MDVVDSQEDVQQHLFKLLALIWQGVVRREKSLDFGPDAAGIEVLGQRLGGREGLDAVGVAAGQVLDHPFVHEVQRRALASIDVLSRFKKGHSFSGIAVLERTINARIGKLVCAGGYGGGGEKRQEDGAPAAPGRRGEMAEQTRPARQKTTRLRSTTLLIFFLPNQELTLFDALTSS